MHETTECTSRSVACPPVCLSSGDGFFSALRNRHSVPGRRSAQVKKLYVGNLQFNASEEQLQEWFGQVGVNPSAISLIRDRFPGQSRGFAFIEITNDEEADRAVTSLNGQNFGGRNLVVNEARPQTERSGGGGCRGAGGGGGYGGVRGVGRPGAVRRGRRVGGRARLSAAAPV